MQKLTKNWILTLIVFILLTAFAVLMFLDGLDVGGLRFADRLLHLIASFTLLLYAVFVLFPLLWCYTGAARFFALGEILILLLIAAAYTCTEWIDIPLFSSLEVCSLLGIALWLRGAVKTVQSYLGAAEGQERTSLWKLVLFILICAVGVWQLIDPSITDRIFIFVIAAAAAVIAVIFAVLTVSNRKASNDARTAPVAQQTTANDMDWLEEVTASAENFQLPETTTEEEA